MVTQDQIRSRINDLIEAIEGGDADAEGEASYDLHDMIVKGHIVGDQARLIEDCCTVDDPEALEMLRRAAEY